MMVPIIAILIYWFANPDIFTLPLRSVMTLIISTYILSSMAVLLVGIVDYYLDIYIVTDRRIVSINQQGLFNREISELHLHQIQDINAKVRGVFETIFHFGDVYIQTAGERANFTFSTIPQPYVIAKRIIELNEHHIKNHIENSVEELEEKKPKNQVEAVRQLQQEMVNLVKKPKIDEVIENTNQKISQSEQAKMERVSKKDTITEENMHYLMPFRKSKIKNKKIDKEGPMKEGKEIGIK